MFTDNMKHELERRLSNLDMVEALFRNNVGQWIEARSFELPGGRQAWRSRIAECRTKRGMHIENRLDHDKEGRVTASYYRFLEYAPVGRDSTRPAPSESKHPPIVQTLFPVFPR